MTEPIILVGGGGHCMACIDVIEQQKVFHIAGIVDTKDKAGELVLGYPIICGDEKLSELAQTHDNFLITIGQIKRVEKRISLFITLKKLNVNLPVVMSPHAYVSKHAIIKKGTIIMHHALITAGAIIGRNCIVNSNALVEHGAAVEDHCHISTGAIINGEAHIKEGCFIGSGAIIREGITVGEKSVISAGVCVMHDVEAKTILKQ
ncbi:MAG: acetyltransferase [Proteobacteria bacterium]|nr:acetyltransferase [Pseudomonadota bacterium]MBU1583883.1 acetyltransferase [Pseudomonadota bacterium]MBU2452348.1 acetyltransferase [Pseudomonadota bacterium]MBU2632063.1 acetyltransferase [Pseudomonadota bacterium]